MWYSIGNGLERDRRGKKERDDGEGRKEGKEKVIKIKKKKRSVK